MALGLILKDGENATAVLYKSIVCVSKNDMVITVYINGRVDPLFLHPKTAEERDNIFTNISTHMMEE